MNPYTILGWLLVVVAALFVLSSLMGMGRPVAMIDGDSP